MIRLTGIDGVVNLNKPARWSSAKAVTAIRSLIGGRGRRVGHSGTLDPHAVGVLVLLVGRATHLAELLMDAGKEYIVSIRLGARSSTDDAEGQLHALPGHVPDRLAVEQTVRRFIGRIEQSPPAHSAIKITGKRAYKLARRGRDVQPAPRAVRIDHIEVMNYDWPTLGLRIVCGRGTYIRSLARDIGQALGVGGYVWRLVRARVGPFLLEDAIDVESCRRDNIGDWLLPVERAIDHLPDERRVCLDERQCEMIGRGIDLTAARVNERLAAAGRPTDDEPIAAVDASGRLVAMCRLVGAALRPVHVLRPRFGPLPKL